MATETRRKADIEVVDLASTPLRELNHGVGAFSARTARTRWQAV